MDLVFQCHLVEAEGQHVITVNKGLHRYPAVASVRKQDMYRKGLQQNHRDLVSMREVMNSLTYLLNALHSAKTLTKDRYEKAIAAYSPFTDGHVEFDTIKEFLVQEGR